MAKISSFPDGVSRGVAESGGTETTRERQALEKSEILFQSEDGAYVFIECKSRVRLEEEAAVKFSCVDNVAYFWNKIKAGKLRLFSLREKGGESAVSVLYDTRYEEIVSLDTNDFEVKKEAPYFIPLCQALFALSRKMPLRGCADFPESLGFWTRNGEEEGGTLLNQIPSFLFGEARLCSFLSRQQAATISRLYGLSLNLGVFEPHGFLPNLSCTLESDKTSIRWKNLLSAAHLYFPDAFSVELIGLRSCADFCADKAQSISAPAMHAAWRFKADSVRSLSLPSLREVEGIFAPQAVEVDLSSLERTRKLFFPSLPRNKVNLDALQRADEIVFQDVKLRNYRRKPGKSEFYSILLG